MHCVPMHSVPTMCTLTVYNVCTVSGSGTASYLVYLVFLVMWQNGQESEIVLNHRCIKVPIYKEHKTIVLYTVSPRLYFNINIQSLRIVHLCPLPNNAVENTAIDLRQQRKGIPWSEGC